MNKFGECNCCGTVLMPIWFTENEYKKGIKTGRVRRAISHLECPNCLKNYVIDDSFDGDWRTI